MYLVCSELFSLPRKLFISVLMIVSDLSCTMKPWPIHVKHVKCLVEEFMQQGDYEKSLGMTPLAMMDRDYKHLLPQVEVFYVPMLSFSMQPS